MSKEYEKWKSDQMLPGGKVRKPIQCANCGQVYYDKTCNTCGYSQPKPTPPPPPPQYGTRHVNWYATDNVNTILEKAARELDRLHGIIETLDARITELEQNRYVGICAECYKPAMVDDYLCREHREAI